MWNALSRGWRGCGWHWAGMLAECGKGRVSDGRVLEELRDHAECLTEHGDQSSPMIRIRRDFGVAREDWH